LNSRERVTRAIEFCSPDRTPIMHGVLPAAFFRYGQELADLLNEFPDDFRAHWEPAKREKLIPGYRSGENADEWGCVWTNEIEGMLGICTGHPLEDWSNWSSYKLPEVPRHVDNIRRGAGSNDFYTFGFGFNMFEQMQWLRGYETLMYDLALGASEAYTLRDALVEWAVEYGRKSAETNIDGMHFGDDWGTQISLIISPDAWRRFYKPAYAKMFQPGKARGKHIHFHTDGFTWEILHDLVEIGVDVLNVQHTIMDIRKLAAEFGGKVAFRSDLDRQHILPHGTREQIRAHVKEVVDCLGSYGGGLIGHGEIAPDVPIENVRAMLEAWREFGTLSF